jgi:hypothetical protein
MAWILCASLFCWQITPVLPSLTPLIIGYWVSVRWYDET